MGVASGRCQRCTRDDRVCKLTKHYQPQEESASPQLVREAANRLCGSASFKPVEDGSDIDNSKFVTLFEGYAAN